LESIARIKEIITVLSFQPHRALKGYLFVLAATLIWSGNFVVARILSDVVPPATLVVLRSVIAAVVMTPFVIGPLRNEIRLVIKHLAYLGLTAFLGITMCNYLVYVAAATSNALNMSLIAIFSPVFTVLFARMFLQDTLTIRKVTGLLWATAGVAILVTKGQFYRLADLTVSTGDFWMLGQAVSFAFYSILVRKRPLELSSLTFLFCMFVLGLLPCLPWFDWERVGSIIGESSPTVLGAILYLGIGPSLLAYLCWNRSVEIIGPTRAAFVYYCIPLFSGLEGIVLLHETVSIVHLLSGGFILGGIIFATKE
jgi:drug/metabolite transporter (DMT)-like permease